MHNRQVKADIFVKEIVLTLDINKVLKNIQVLCDVHRVVDTFDCLKKDLTLKDHSDTWFRCSSLPNI